MDKTVCVYIESKEKISPERSQTIDFKKIKVELKVPQQRKIQMSKQKTKKSILKRVKIKKTKTKTK